jgi:cellulose synthase/poly-beta-1,6-N-acetylglucosamine synthase-like glycosyltransferase
MSATPRPRPAGPLRPFRPDETVAVTVCTRNRPGYLAALLASLVPQTWPAWVLVVNDQSDAPVAEDPAVKDLLALLDTRGHAVEILRTKEPRDRYQRVLEAVPEEIEFVHRIDDDVVVTPTYLEEVVRPFSWFPDRPVAAVGGCLAGPHMTPLRLDHMLARSNWLPRIDRPTWRLQGHHYEEREVLELESLWGCAMCYRRSAVLHVGGWLVEGWSPQIFREDSDMSARLAVAGYEMMVTTAALGWHLVAPSGGARDVEKTPDGANVFSSHRDEYAADDALFRERLRTLLRGYRRDRFERHPMVSPRARARAWLVERLPRGVRRRWGRGRGPGARR